MTQGIIDILIDDSTVQRLVGQNAAENKYKVYPLVVPQDEKPPYIVVKLASKPAIPCKGQRPTSFQPTANVFCYAVNYEETLALETAVINALDGLTAGTYNGINFSYLRYVDTSEDYINTDGTGLYVRLPLFEAQTDESTPT